MNAPSKHFRLHSKRVIICRGSAGSGAAASATLEIRDGKILSVTAGEAPKDRKIPLIDVGDKVVMAGIVDTHAHINEPGRTEWEGFETATRAAAAGGITTVIDMPLNSIPATTSLKALQVKQESAEGRCRIDYGFWGGVVPGNTAELEPMVEAGAMGFKAFLVDSGVPEFQMSSEPVLREAMNELARLDVPLLAHAELESAVSPSVLGARTYASYLESRPQRWEVDALRLLVRLAKEARCRVHIVHLSAADALEDLRRAKAEGVPITAETCPHYLTIASEDIAEGATQFKCAPPIRERANQQRLWKAVSDWTVDFIVSDHSPCTPELKCLESGDFSAAWGGIAGLQFSLPVVWTAMSARGMSLVDLSLRMSTRTAAFAGLAGIKGALVPGADADLVIFDPEESFTLNETDVLHRHRLTPYAGRKLRGVVHQTFVRGVLVYDRDAAVSKRFPGSPQGKQVFRKEDS